MLAHPLPADTIVALATAPGRGATALVRLSGARAFPIAERLTGDAALPPRRATLMALRHPERGDLLDRALVTRFPAPHSYTGEDTVEISTHGGALVPRLVLNALLAAGARLAEPGEFTRRAYLNGKLDLLQAEAVLDLIDGAAPALHRAAIHQLERGLSRRIEALRDAILGAEALLIHAIDFPEEDEPPVPPARIRAAVADVAAWVDALLATAPPGELLREGALTVLAGRPNSGKSSLFNALLGSERAIVTEIPGTTRDALEALLSLDGYPFRVVDTAGLRSTTDRVEEMGIEVARRYLAAADLVLVCIEAGRAPDEEEREFLAMLQPARVVVVRTKADLHAGPETPARVALPEVRVAAREGTGMPELRQRLLERAFGGLLDAPADAPLLTRERHARALRAARADLGAFLGAMDEQVAMEFAATHLRDAVAALEELIGAVTVDDRLDRVFREFCVGK